MKFSLKSLNRESVSSLLDTSLKSYERASLVISDEFWKNFNFGLERTSNELIPYIEGKIKPKIKNYLTVTKEGFLDLVRRDLPDIKVFASLVGGISIILLLNVVNPAEIDPMNEYYKRLYSKLDLSQKLAYHQIVDNTKKNVIKNPGLEGIIIDGGAIRLHQAYWSKENDTLGYRWGEKELKDIFNFDVIIEKIRDPLKQELTTAQINAIPRLVRNFGNIEFSEKIEWIKKLRFHESLELSLEEAYNFIGGKLIIESLANDFKVFETSEGMHVVGPVESNKGALYSHQVLPKTKSFVKWWLDTNLRGNEYKLTRFIKEGNEPLIKSVDLDNSGGIRFITISDDGLSIDNILNSWVYSEDFKELVSRYSENLDILKFWHSLPSEVDRSNLAGVIYAGMIADKIDEPLKIRGRELDKLTIVAACYNCGGNRRKTGDIFWGSVTNYADQLIKKYMVLFRDLRPVIDALETTRKYEELGMYNIEILSKMKLPRTYNSTLVNNYPKL